MKIYIVRHGETKANSKGILQGHLDTDLTDNGINLALITGEALKNIKFDIAISSPLKRAYDTASLILSKNNNKNIKLITDDRLKEINMGDWEGKAINSDNSPFTKKEIQAFFNNPFKLKDIPNGEIANDVCKRTQEFLNELVKENKYETVLITTHGFALRAMLNFMYENKEDFWQGHVPYNLAVNILNYQDNKFSFVEKDKIYYDKDQCIDRYKL